MSGNALPLLARLAEAASFPQAVRAYEDDPWGYLRRKLLECEAPLREYKRALYDEASRRLLADLQEPFLKPSALMDHKESFEKLLPLSEFADLCFHLEAGGDPASRREGARTVLAATNPKTAFDVEALPAPRRGKAWETLVDELWRRLQLDRLSEIAGRGERTPFRRALLARRARRNLAEFLSVTRSELGMREEITLFILARLEAAIAALLRFVRVGP